MCRGAPRDAPPPMATNNTKRSGDYGIVRNLLDTDAAPYDPDNGETVGGNAHETRGDATTEGTLDDMLNHMDGIDEPVHEQLDDLSLTQREIIAHAADNPDTSHREIADAVGCTQQIVDSTLTDHDEVFEAAKRGFLDDALTGVPTEEKETIRIRATPEAAEQIRTLVSVLGNDAETVPMDAATDPDPDTDVPSEVLFLDYIREYRETHGERPTLKDLRECPAELPVADPSASLTTLANYRNLLNRTKNENGTYVYRVNERGREELREYNLL